MAPRVTAARAKSMRRSARSSPAVSRLSSCRFAADHLQQIVEVVGDAAGWSWPSASIFCRTLNRLLRLAQPLAGANPEGYVAGSYWNAPDQLSLTVAKQRRNLMSIPGAIGVGFSRARDVDDLAIHRSCPDRHGRVPGGRHVGEGVGQLVADPQAHTPNRRRNSLT